jgi:tetratricopeptide (TPR) repeat protein
MKTVSRTTALAVVPALALALTGCNQFGMLKARKNMKDAHLLYQQQDYKRAAEKYEEAIQADPNAQAAYFYLANSYDQLYKPSRAGEPENDEYLKKAVETYRLASEREQDPLLRKRSLEFLVAAYGPDKLNDPTEAEPIVMKIIEADPAEPTNYFVLAKLYEDSGRYEEAEATLMKAKEVKPKDPAVYLQLAGYFNRQGEFDKTIEALEQRASNEPENPEAFYTIATYFWEKAYRDFRITEAEKRDYIMKGIDAVNKALSLKQDYMEAMTYKNILLRMQANIETDRVKQAALIKEADELRDRALELRKQRAAGVGG